MKLIIWIKKVESGGENNSLLKREESVTTWLPNPG